MFKRSQNREMLREMGRERGRKREERPHLSGSVSPVSSRTCFSVNTSTARQAPPLVICSVKTEED